MKLTHILVALLLCAAASLAAAPINVIPLPAEIKTTGNSTATLTSSTDIVCADAALARTYADTLRNRTGIKFPIRPTQRPNQPSILVEIIPTSTDPYVSNPEGYSLKITADNNILIQATTRTGAFYALQTLVQLATPNGNSSTLPLCEILDAPRFKWRGAHLDVCRHFFGPDAVKTLLDTMALYKFNTFHWHLTDDQGWRIEIKKYPLLTTIGAWRAASPIQGDRDILDDTPHGGYYTQDEIREIVAYARERNITIMPEIEIPGHSSAALAAYPQFGNTDIPDYAPVVMPKWGVIPYTFAPKEETFKFLENILDEVFALFPDSPYIHIGGDEAPKKQWEASPFAQQVMRENNLKDAHELQSWFLRRIEKYVNSHNRRIVGWDEIQEGGLSPSATMMVWRNWKWATQAIEQGNDVIMTPNTHCYLDYPYDPESMPKTPYYQFIGYWTKKPRSISLEKAYQFEPIPEGTAPEREKQVLGCQANLWGEYLYDWNKAQYFLFPRFFAISEVAWSPKSSRNWDNFQSRLPSALQYLDSKKINYRKSDGTPSQGTITAPPQ